MARLAVVLVGLVLGGGSIAYAATRDGEPRPADPAAGSVRFVRRADAGFDRFSREPSAQLKRWMQSRVFRATVFSPYWDSRSSWYSNGWAYHDLYAIYADSELAREHPEWILRDTSGARLYIPFGCDGSTCPQYAGDITDPAFRAHWIAQSRATLARGRYKGLWIDDVNLDPRVSDASERSVLPVDSRTGRPMTGTAWRTAMADFVSEVRAAFPGIEIVHNAIWYAGGAQRQGDPQVQREIRAADWVNLERGVNDAGLTGGTGPFALRTFLAYVDRVHAMGKAVVLDGSATSSRARNYTLAAYFLTSGPRDAIGAGSGDPSSLWRGYGVRLGSPKGGRRTWQGLLRRDFSGGMALLNEPGAPRRVVRLPRTMRTADGKLTRTVTLDPASGLVLTR